MFKIRKILLIYLKIRERERDRERIIIYWFTPQIDIKAEKRKRLKSAASTFT